MDTELKNWIKSNDVLLKTSSELADKDNWDAYRYEHMQRIRHAAKYKGLEYNLTEDDFVYPENCPILGIKLTRKLGRGNSPSVDRVDNSKGYVKGNVRIISDRANTLKNCLTIEILDKLKLYMLGEI